MRYRISCAQVVYLSDTFTTDGDGLLHRQQRRQADAYTVIDTLDVLERWRRFGVPFLCGAVAHGLLVAPDIDVEIFGHPRASAGFALVSEWADDPAVRRVLFINALDGDDAGLGWEIRYRLRDVDWSVQMWLLPVDYSGPRSAALVEAMRDALDRTARCAVLRIKEALVRRAGAYRSIDDYRAVLDDGVKDLDEYDEWCRLHSSTGLISWKPRVARTAPAR
jgi:hypothetical protein